MSANPQRNGKQAIFRWTVGDFDVGPYLKEKAEINPYYTTPHGALFAADCMAVLPLIADRVIDTIFYYSKGKPKTFRRIRTSVQTCRHCGGEVKDHGGHRGALNPNGITLKDVWSDIPPVRHWKFKSKKRRANALSTKLLDRVVEMSTVEADLVLDPFGGSGTTFSVCEDKRRRWIGIEIDFAPEIAERLESDEIHSHKNDDFVEG